MSWGEEDDLSAVLGGPSSSTLPSSSSFLPSASHNPFADEDDTNPFSSSGGGGGGFNEDLGVSAWGGTPYEPPEPSRQEEVAEEDDTRAPYSPVRDYSTSAYAQPALQSNDDDDVPFGGQSSGGFGFSPPPSASIALPPPSVPASPPNSSSTGWSPLPPPAGKKEDLVASLLGDDTGLRSGHRKERSASTFAPASKWEKQSALASKRHKGLASVLFGEADDAPSTSTSSAVKSKSKAAAAAAASSPVKKDEVEKIKEGVDKLEVKDTPPESKEPEAAQVETRTDSKEPESEAQAATEVEEEPQEEPVAAVAAAEVEEPSEAAAAETATEEQDDDEKEATPTPVVAEPEPEAEAAEEPTADTSQETLTTTPSPSNGGGVADAEDESSTHSEESFAPVPTPTAGLPTPPMSATHSQTPSLKFTPVSTASDLPSEDEVEAETDTGTEEGGESSVTFRAAAASDGEREAAETDSLRGQYTTSLRQESTDDSIGLPGSSSTTAPPTPTVPEVVALPSSSTLGESSGAAAGGGWGGEQEDFFDQPLPTPPNKEEEQFRAHAHGSREAGASDDGLEDVNLDSGAASTAAPSSPPLPSLPTGASPMSPPLGASTSGPSAADEKKNAAFTITVGDPQKIGSSLNPSGQHTVYTVRTKTSSRLFRKSDFSVLRRFSHFLWLFDALCVNNPGVVVPSMPSKSALGRFDMEFVEQRRAALQLALNEIVRHPMLVGDPDLRLFLESDTFAVDIKQKRVELPGYGGGPSAEKGFLGSWTSSIGPKFVEYDEYFEQRRAQLDTFEAQLKSFAVTLVSCTKLRHAVFEALGDLEASFATLSQCELSPPLRSSLAKAKEVQASVRLLGIKQIESEAAAGGLTSTAESYVRLCASVRIAFAARVKAYHSWQAAESAFKKARQAHDKAKKSGRASGEILSLSLAEIGDAERRALDAKTTFDDIAKVIKAEMARFDKEKIEDFKRAVQGYVGGLVARQREVVHTWQMYHDALMKAAEVNHQAQLEAAKAQQERVAAVLAETEAGPPQPPPTGYR